MIGWIPWYGQWWPDGCQRLFCRPPLPGRKDRLSSKKIRLFSSPNKSEQKGIPYVNTLFRFRDVFPRSQILIFIHPGSRIRNKKRRKIVAFPFLWPKILQSLKLFYFWTGTGKKLSQLTKNNINFYENNRKASDPEKPIPDWWSQILRSKRHQLPDPDTQHCVNIPLTDFTKYCRGVFFLIYQLFFRSEIWNTECRVNILFFSLFTWLAHKIIICFTVSFYLMGRMMSSDRVSAPHFLTAQSIACIPYQSKNIIVQTFSKGTERTD